jgi:hypothetical protein
VKIHKVTASRKIHQLIIDDLLASFQIYSLGQFTGVASRSAGLERHCLEDKLPYSKIPSIFDHSAQNLSTFQSIYHMGMLLRRRLWQRTTKDENGHFQRK